MCIKKWIKIVNERNPHREGEHKVDRKWIRIKWIKSNKKSRKIKEILDERKDCEYN